MLGMKNHDQQSKNQAIAMTHQNFSRISKQDLKRLPTINLTTPFNKSFNFDPRNTKLTYLTETGSCRVA